MERRSLLRLLTGGLAMGLAGCAGEITTDEENDESIEAVDAFYQGVVNDDETEIEMHYWGDIDQVRQEAGVGIHPLGVGYQEVTDVTFQTIEAVSLEEFLSDRTGMDGTDLDEELDSWEEGIPTYLDEIGVDDYQCVYVEADIEVLGETEREVDYLFVVQSEDEWYIAEMPHPRDVALFDVGMQAQAFDPEELIVETGTEVVWRNTAARMHTVTATSVPEDGDYFASGGYDSYEEAETAYFDDRSGALNDGDQHSHTFEAPGTYEYESIPFAESATGTIVVE